MTRNVADDASNPNKTTIVNNDRFKMIDSEANPNAYKEVLWSLIRSTLAASSSETLTGTSTTKFVTPDTLNDVVTRIPKPGEMLNGKLSVTVATSDITVAIKTLAGADPSASDPVYVNINGTVRTITAATNLTLLDGTNYFNAGSAELATQQIDYFVYAVWDSNSSLVRVCFARIPYGRLVSDFSATDTNEKYLANYAEFTSTDDLCVIGRFAATLSAGAAYTWSVPAFTGANLIHEPIFRTRVLTYAPVANGITMGNSTLTGKYWVEGGKMHFLAWFKFGASGASITGAVDISFPFAVASSDTVGAMPNGFVQILDSGTALYVGQAYVANAGTVMNIRVLNASATYTTLTALSSTVPMTWAANDQIDVSGWHFIA